MLLHVLQLRSRFGGAGNQFSQAGIPFERLRFPDQFAIIRVNGIEKDVVLGWDQDRRNTHGKLVGMNNPLLADLGGDVMATINILTIRI